jgi:hypothetical protein
VEQRLDVGRLVVTAIAVVFLSADAFLVMLGISALANAFNGAPVASSDHSWLYPAQAAVFLGAPTAALLVALGRGLDVRYRLRGSRDRVLRSAFTWWLLAQALVLLVVPLGV